MDDLSAGRLENIPDDANFVCCDVKSPLARDVVKNGHFDAIVHLAAQTMVPASMEDPKKDMEDNIEGTVNILEAARKYGVKRIIFSSSAAVYGDIAPECLPVRETEPLRPVSFYGLSKMTCENYIRLYQKAYGLSYVIFRFANVYGERQGNGGEGGVVSILPDSWRKGNRRPFMETDSRRGTLFMPEILPTAYGKRCFRKRRISPAICPPDAK